MEATQTHLPRRKQRSLAMTIVESIAQRVRDGAIAPGDKLPTEAAVMEEFGVSRTVVREAISKLQTSGLVETRHGIGTFVVVRRRRGAIPGHAGPAGHAARRDRGARTADRRRD